MTHLLTETKNLIDELNQFYELMKNLGTKFDKPTLDDALDFADTEAGELLDTYIRIYRSNYARNNKREIDENEIWMEYTQCMVMLMASLPNNYCDEHKYIISEFNEYAKVKNQPLSELEIKSVCVDVHNLFNHANAYSINTVTKISLHIPSQSFEYIKLKVINNMVYTLITRDKLEFFKKVLDKWLQNHYVKHLLIGFNLNVSIYNVYDLYQKGYISSLC